MKSKIILSVALLLCLATLFSMLSCTDSGKTSDTTKSSSSKGDEDTQNPMEKLPDDQYGGYEFTFLNFDPTISFWQTNTINVEDLSQDKVVKEIYERNRFIEDKYSVFIKEITNTSPLNEARKVIGAGEDAYDVVLVFANQASALSDLDYLINWDELPYVDLEQPWWNQDMKKELSIAGNLYFINGSLSLTPYDCTSLIAFNKQMADDHNLDDLFQLVRDGKWTLDKMGEMMREVTEDVDNDGRFTAVDTYGVLSYTGIYTEFMWASGVRFVEKDQDDHPVYTATKEKFTDVYLKVLDILNNDNVLFNIDIFTEFKGNPQKFIDNEALFFSDVLFWISKMVDMEADYGILPNPKYDEQQEHYHASINPTTTVLTIPYVAEDLERTSVILEAMSIHSHYNLIPTFYDEIVTIRNVRDEESREMLENYVFKNRMMDLGSIYNWGGIFNVVKTYAASNKREISSLIARTQSSVESSIEKFIDVYS